MCVLFPRFSISLVTLNLFIESPGLFYCLGSASAIVRRARSPWRRLYGVVHTRKLGSDPRSPAAPNCNLPHRDAAGAGAPHMRTPQHHMKYR